MSSTGHTLPSSAPAFDEQGLRRRVRKSIAIRIVAGRRCPSRYRSGHRWPRRRRDHLPEPAAGDAIIGRAHGSGPGLVHEGLPHANPPTAPPGHRHRCCGGCRGLLSRSPLASQLLINTSPLIEIRVRCFFPWVPSHDGMNRATGRLLPMASASCAPGTDSSACYGNGSQARQPPIGAAGLIPEADVQY